MTKIGQPKKEKKKKKKNSSQQLKEVQRQILTFAISFILF